MPELSSLNEKCPAWFLIKFSNNSLTLLLSILSPCFETAVKKQNNNLLEKDLPLEFTPPMTLILFTSMSALLIGPKLLIFIVI